MVPILKETYHATFNGTKAPTYNKVKIDFVRESHVLGVLSCD